MCGRDGCITVLNALYTFARIAVCSKKTVLVCSIVGHFTVIFTRDCICADGHLAKSNTGDDADVRMIMVMMMTMEMVMVMMMMMSVDCCRL